MNPLLVVVLVLCPVIPLLVLRVQARGLRRDRRRHHDEMARLATLTGGRLSTPPADTAPWSARFRPAFESIVTAGPLARMTVFSPPEYPHATDFVRHGRSVRVSEAMLVKQRFAASRGDSHVRWECRIDVPAPTSPRIEIGPNRSAVPHPEKLRLPSELTRHLGVETTDPRFASLVLTPEAVDALVRTWEHLPGVVRLEGGLLFLVTEGGTDGRTGVGRRRRPDRLPGPGPDARLAARRADPGGATRCPVRRRAATVGPSGSPESDDSGPRERRRLPADGLLRRAGGVAVTGPHGPARRNRRPLHHGDALCVEHHNTKYRKRHPPGSSAWSTEQRRDPVPRKPPCQTTPESSCSYSWSWAA